ncbi:uncharacterized protein LOC111870236 [Cryptotermes secundus]|uniref:uncharacterized protein LOC111870236 n=1 Tax=Cryptotermes secundus TaxID=105785 RepID=UPI000CD7C3D9|nr:uncharacterized protein LOC111870236 [Cryptotermes secundus]
MRITSSQGCMSEPLKQECRSVKSNQTVEGSVEKIIKDVDHVSSESVVSTSTVCSEISGHGKKSCSFAHESVKTQEAMQSQSELKRLEIGIEIEINPERDLLKACGCAHSDMFAHANLELHDTVSIPIVIEKETEC